MMIKRALFCIFISLISLCECKPPSLTPKDAKMKIEEILKAHATYHELTPSLVARALQNYLEEIDPVKMYYIDSEVLKWTSPTPELLEKVLNGYKREDFSVFEEIHATMAQAIQRRNELERKINLAKLPEHVEPSEFKDVKWAKNEEELLNRLVRIKALQIEAAQKLAQETKQQFIQRLSKRRFNREEELIAHSPAERKQLVLSYVLKATSSALDSQTAYFTPTEANQFMIQVQQRLFGIGAQLRDDLNGFSIVRLLEGGPASLENKLKTGDRIIAVDNEPVLGMDIAEAVELIRGQQGTKVLLTILREVVNGEEKKEEKLDIEIIRGEVVLKESRFDVKSEPYDNGIIGIIRLHAFYQDSHNSSASDLYKAIVDLKKDHNLKGIILDLRNNGGGLLSQAVSVSRLFFPKEVIIPVKDNTGEVHYVPNDNGKFIWEGALLVLTNRASASAAEIVAQTLQDYGRALVVGDPQTYGKGTFQTFTLEAAHYGKVNPKGEFKVTRGRYYTASGKSPQLHGVSADIQVPGILSLLDIGEKFSKYPLENEQLPSFLQKGGFYSFHMQSPLNLYASHVTTLRDSSEKRIAQNADYQAFLTELNKKEELSDATIELSEKVDLQLNETLKIMQEYLELSKKIATAA